MSFLVPFLVPESKKPINKAFLDPNFSKNGTIFVSFFGTGTKFAKFFGTFLAKNEQFLDQNGPTHCSSSPKYVQLSGTKIPKYTWNCSHQSGTKYLPVLPL